MFLKHRIMRKLDFGSYTSLDEVISWFPRTSQERVGSSIDTLGKLGFIKPSSDCISITLSSLSALQDFNTYCAKQFFEYAVGASAIVVALESLLNIVQTIPALFR